VTETEPEWDDTERAWAVALAEVEADLCDGCGQPLSETTRREAFEGYEVPDPAACQGCKALITKQTSDEYAESKYLPAFRWGLIRTWDEPVNEGT
jgi:MinD superfamily P-loop ATPase